MRRARLSAIAGGSGLGWVSIRPGLTQFTRMPYGASSIAATREKLSVAARLLAYAAAPAEPRLLTPEEKLMIRPPWPWLDHRRPASWVIRKVPRQFTA